MAMVFWLSVAPALAQHAVSVIAVGLHICAYSLSSCSQSVLLGLLPGFQCEILPLHFAARLPAFRLCVLHVLQRKLAQEIAQGLPVAAEEREDQSMKLHHSLWIILNVTTEVSLSVASRLGSGSCSDGGSGGCTGGGMPIVRQVCCKCIKFAFPFILFNPQCKNWQGT